MKSKRIFMIYIWSCVWQVFFAGFLFVDSSGCFHTCFVFLFFLAVCPVSISLKWSVAGGHCAEAFGGCVKTSIVTVGCAMYFLNEPKSRHCRRRSWFANQSDPLLGLNEGKQQEHQGEKQKTTAKLTTGYEQLWNCEENDNYYVEYAGPSRLHEASSGHHYTKLFYKCVHPTLSKYCFFLLVIYT